MYINPQEVFNKNDHIISNKISEKTQSPHIIDPNNTLFNSFVGIDRLPSGKLKIENKLGAGAFGEVMCGIWNNRKVAMKKIDFKLAMNNLNLKKKEAIESLQWEISCLSTVNHPNLVQFYGIYQHENEGHTYIVMEFCEGGELKNKLQNEPDIPWTKRWQWALEVTQALAYLHHEGILHRDLKAENILLDKNDRAKLADLGVAQIDALLEKKEPNIVSKGIQDKRFIAPENIKDERLSTKATDIYALGLVFWEIASSKNVRKILDLEYFENWLTGKHIEREPIPQSCPERFKELILDCWKIIPDERPSAKNLIKRLKKLGYEFNGKHHVLIKACNKLEKLIHPKRKEALVYIKPFITARKVEGSIENYWDKWEENNSRPNPPLDLENIFLKFIKTPECSTLLLLGDSGLGKTLTTYVWADELIKQWWAYIKNPSLNRPNCFPIFIRPMISNWTHTALKGAYLNIFNKYGLENIPMVVFVDGYDELQMDENPINLIEQLGLGDYNNIKLIVTCRPNIMDNNKLFNNLFNFKGMLETYYFLPFCLSQLLEYLTNQLSWGKETQNEYEKTLKNSKSIRELRNPFVLYLLCQSWETLSKKPLDKVSRWQIYEGFVKHTITTHCLLLSPELQTILTVDYLSLEDSFNAFACDIALKSYQNKNITFSKEEAVKLKYTWVKLEAFVREDAEKKLIKREEKLNKESGKKNNINKKRRVLLNKYEFIEMMQRRRQQFERILPLRIRGKEYEFSHKSFFEYFVAKKLLQFCDKDNLFLKENIELFQDKDTTNFGIFLMKVGKKQKKVN